MSLSRQSAKRNLILGYLLSVILVPVYVSMFSVWRQLNAVLPDTMLMLLPIALTILLTGFVLYLFSNRLRSESSGRAAVICGAIICFVALFIPDPDFPAKRIHVAEYMLLSAVVRFAMSYRLQGGSLLIFSLLFTGVLGVHDEFLQGLHPDRTYGLRDMTVNFLGACGGALIWHGLHLFRRKVVPAPAPSGGASTATLLYLFCLLTGVIGYVWPYSYYTGMKELPLWPAMILIGTMVYFSIYDVTFNPRWQHGVRMLSSASFSLLIYFVLANVAKITFY